MDDSGKIHQDVEKLSTIYHQKIMVKLRLKQTCSYR